MFLLDKAKFVRRFTPQFLRMPKMLAWLKVKVWHMFFIWDESYTYFNQLVAELNVTIAQDVFQAYLRTIYPDVGIYKVFVKTQWENIPQRYLKFKGEHFKQEYAYKLSEATPHTYNWFRSERDLPYDYYVILPVTYTGNLPDIEFLVKKYRPAGKRYLILFQNIIS